MLSAKRWAISLVVLVLLLAGGAVAWFYYGHLPRKVPLRARPVCADTLVRPPAAGRNPAAPAQVREHNKWNNEHTISVPKTSQGGI